MIIMCALTAAIIFATATVIYIGWQIKPSANDSAVEVSIW